MSSDMRDYLDGNVPRNPEQQRSHEDTLAHACMKTDGWRARNQTTAVEYLEVPGRTVSVIHLPEGTDPEQFMSSMTRTLAQKADPKEEFNEISRREVEDMEFLNTEEEVKERIDMLNDLKFKLMRQNAHLVTEEMQIGLTREQKIELLKLKILSTNPSGLFVRLPE